MVRISQVPLGKLAKCILESTKKHDLVVGLGGAQVIFLEG